MVPTYAAHTLPHEQLTTEIGNVFKNITVTILSPSLLSNIFFFIFLTIKFLFSPSFNNFFKFSSWSPAFSFLDHPLQCLLNTLILRTLVVQPFVLRQRALLQQVPKAFRPILLNNQLTRYINLLKLLRPLLASQSRPIWCLRPAQLGIPPQKMNLGIRAWFCMTRLIVPTLWVPSTSSLLYIHTLLNPSSF